MQIYSGQFLVEVVKFSFLMTFLDKERTGKMFRKKIMKIGSPVAPFQTNKLLLLIII